jgi:hypothetical protein
MAGRTGFALFALFALVATMLAAPSSAGAAPPQRMYLGDDHRIVAVDLAAPDKKVVLVPHVQSRGAELAVTARYLFWIDSAESSSEGQLWRADLDGGNAHAIVPHVDAAGQLATAGRFVFWLGPGGISRASLDGSGVTRNLVKLAPQLSGAGADGITTDGHYLYFSNCEKGSIGRVSPDGSGLVERLVVIGKAGCPQVIATAGGFIYWSELNGSNVQVSGNPPRIGRARLDGSEVDDRWLLTRAKDGPYRVAGDGRFVYWTHLVFFSKKKFHWSIGRVRADGAKLRQEFVTDTRVGGMAIGSNDKP